MLACAGPPAEAQAQGGGGNAALTNSLASMRLVGGGAAPQRVPERAGWPLPPAAQGASPPREAGERKRRPTPTPTGPERLRKLRRFSRTNFPSLDNLQALDAEQRARADAPPAPCFRRTSSVPETLAGLVGLDLAGSAAAGLPADPAAAPSARRVPARISPWDAYRDWLAAHPEAHKAERQAFINGILQAGKGRTSPCRTAPRV